MHFKVELLELGHYFRCSLFCSRHIGGIFSRACGTANSGAHLAGRPACQALSAENRAKDRGSEGQRSVHFLLARLLLLALYSLLRAQQTVFQGSSLAGVSFAKLADRQITLFICKLLQSNTKVALGFARVGVQTILLAAINRNDFVLPDPAPEIATPGCIVLFICGYRWTISIARANLIFAHEIVRTECHRLGVVPVDGNSTIFEFNGVQFFASFIDVVV